MMVTSGVICRPHIQFAVIIVDGFKVYLLIGTFLLSYVDRLIYVKVLPLLTIKILNLKLVFNSLFSPVRLKIRKTIIRINFFII